MNKKIGTWVKEERKKLGWGLLEGAQKLGISKTQLHKIETGKVARPKMKFLKNVASILGLPLDEVVLSGGRLPEDVYYKIVANPELIKKIREF